MEELNKTYEMIEAIFVSQGVDPSKARGAKPGQWSFTKGSAKIWVDVWYIAKEKRSYFQVMSPIMRFPLEGNQPGFFKELLELNDKMYGVAFTIFNGYAWLKHIREVTGLDSSEALATMHRVAIYADTYDDHLKNTYGEGPVNPGSPPGGAGVPSGPVSGT